jgi:4-methylaminobutanoate oxidase (formaldehyde-forming)
MGPSTYTPDGLFVLGPVPGVEGFLAATGCCGGGIAGAGGIGLIVAHLAACQTPPWDATPFRPDRFGSIAPFDPTFRQLCGLARSGKTSG